MKWLGKLEYWLQSKNENSYGIRGIANDCSKSNLTNRMQYISVDGNSSDVLKVDFGVSQGSILGDDDDDDDDDDCFCGMVDRRKVSSLNSSRDHCQRSSPSRIINTLRAEFEPAQNLISGLVE